MEEWVYCRCLNISEIDFFLIRYLPKSYSRYLDPCVSCGQRLVAASFNFQYLRLQGVGSPWNISCAALRVFNDGGVA